MASNDTSGNQPCLICLETPDVLKVLPTCKHAFCSKCLTNHMQKLGPASKSFQCPSCKADCPLPEAGVDGLHDYDAVNNGEDENTNLAASHRSELTGNEDNVAMCERCHYTGNKDSKAEHLCEECGSIYLCGDCALVHGRTKGTATHVLISLQKRNEGCCKKHRKVINRFCSTCSKSCCHMCILLAHEDHDIIGLVEMFHTLVNELKDKAEEQARRSKELKKFSSQLDIIKSSGLTQRKGILVQEIEDHVEVCIGQIIKQKESLKDQVEDTYKLFTLVSQDVEKAATIGKLDDTLAKADTVLAAAEPTPKCVRELVLVKQEMSKYGIGNEIDIEEYWESYTALLDQSVNFIPNTPDCNIGALKTKGTSHSDVISLDKMKLVFEKRLEVDDPAKFVPCVSIIDDDFYAVAHPTLNGKLSDGIDIYKFPGVFQQTLKEHSDSVYDMAATPNGRLAVLSPGSKQGVCCARLFHSVNGYVNSTKDFPICNPLSFDVNYRHQYVVLNNEGGRRMVTICNEDSSVNLVYDVDRFLGYTSVTRIACSLHNIYIMGKHMYAVYKKENNNFVLLGTSKSVYYDVILNDISVALNDQVTLCYKKNGRFWFRRCSMLTDNNPQQMNGTSRPIRHSVRNDCLVSAMDGPILKVYKG